jgi:hypothetical protein
MESSKDNLTKAERKARKAQRKAEKALAAFEKSNPGSDDNVVTVLCVRFGNKYGIHYVQRLRNMLMRHLTVPYELVCFTDDPTPIEGVRLITQTNSGYIRGWWHKVHMFDPHLPLKGRILYVDLDVVICDNLDKLALFQRNEFVGIRDFNRKFHASWKRLNSSVMAWNAGNQSHIWEEFVKNPNLAMRLHGDQDWIWKTSHTTLKFWPDEWIQSYKWEIRSKNELYITGGKRAFREIRHDVVAPPGCSIAVFHGDPNPCTVYDNFVVDNWK